MSDTKRSPLAICMGSHSEADAALIAHRVDVHDDLLAALKECKHFIADMRPDLMDHDTQGKQERVITAARLAIARATTDTTEKP